MEVRNTMLYNALFAFGICGLVGVLVDLDHLVAYFTGWRGRFFHTPLLIASSLMLVGLGAYLGRLLLE